MAQAHCIFAFEIHVAADYRCPPHGHTCTEIVATGDTVGTLHDSAERAYPYQENQLLVYQPGQSHWIDNRKAGDQVCVGVAGCGESELAMGIYPLSDESAWLIKQIQKLLHQPVSRWVSEKLDLLAGLSILELRQPKESDASTPDNYAERARQLIDSRFDEPLAMEQIASGLFISPTYLRQLFKQSFGCSPIQYLIRRRIEIAGEMLVSTDRPIREIAESCGFENAYYFSRLFRKLNGCSPSEHRRRPQN